MPSLGKFVWNPVGFKRFVDSDIEEWLTGVLIDAQRFARDEVHIDLGFLKSRIQTELERRSDRNMPIVGHLTADANYAVWQEFLPDESIPGVGVRKRAGGKPYLRPGVVKALGPYIR